MADVLTPAQRHRNMAAIKSKDSQAELMVRKIIRSMGYRFSLHRDDLPGKPDIVLSKMKKVVFVNGCYWHLHYCRYGSVIPKTNAKFWKQKRESNRVRDKRNLSELKSLGWLPLVIWECQLKKTDLLLNKIARFLVA